MGIITESIERHYNQRRPSKGNAMAHLRPLSLDEIEDDDIQRTFLHYEKTRGFTPNSIKTMARRPNIVRAFAALNQAILYEGTVEPELKMLVSLMASYAAGCRYCQSHMANLSSLYRAPDDKIAAIWDFETSPLFEDAERAALRLARNAAQLPNLASASDFDELRRFFDDGQIVEIVASIALFGYLNRWNDTMATEVEEHPKSVAARVLGAAGWEPGKHAPSTP
jgi:uncharacterized peroxidase-related enzyme